MFEMSQIEDLYQLFNERRFDEIDHYFDPRVTFEQFNVSTRRRGLKALRDSLVGWTLCFEGATVRVEAFRPNSGRIKEIPGAVQCFTVTLTGTGIYKTTLPGLESRAPATGEQVEVPMKEVLWVNAAGKIIYVYNEITDIGALR